MQPAFVPSHLQLSAFHDHENVRVCGQVQDSSRFLKKAHGQLVGLRCTKMWFLSSHQEPQKKGWVAYSKGYENTLEPQNHLITDRFQPFQRDIYLFPRAAFKKYQKLDALKQHKFSLMVLEAKCPKARWQQVHTPCETCKGILPCLFLASGGFAGHLWHSLACSCVTPVNHMAFSLCAFIITTFL